MEFYTGTGNTVTFAATQTAAAAGVCLEYGRAEGANYSLLRIPRFTLTGKRIKPRVALAGGALGQAAPALTYARQEEAVCVINAGLFNTATLMPQGQTVIDGRSVTNSPMTDDMGAAISNAECYPLCIDENGDLSAPYGRSVSTAQIIADGITGAVTGWGQIIGDFAQCGTDKFNEIVHPGKYIRQCIGQYENGDYLVCTVDCARNGIASNDGGMTYGTLAALLVSRGVKFAYALDGGGSTETVLGRRQVNPIYEGTAGRAVPTVIRFDVAEA